MSYKIGKEKKTVQFMVRYAPTEKAELEKRAVDASLTMSAYLRRKTLGKRVMSIADKKIIHELRRIGGLLKHAHYESDGIYSSNSALALSSLKTVLKSIKNIKKI